jgi:transcriptional regulator with AAA-type ATPase domain
MEDTTIKTESLEAFNFSRKTTPGILVAAAPEGSTTVDRCALEDAITVGRSPDCGLHIRDGKVSKHHFKIQQVGQDFIIEDLGSTNGTRVNGIALEGSRRLDDQAVIRAGSAVIVFHPDAGPFLVPPPSQRFNIAGRFHTGPLIRALREAAVSSRHMLLAGPSGSGKELCAGALAHLLSESVEPLPLLAHNCALFSSEEEAAATLFGVEKRVFSNVDARPGLIERSRGGVLFLDEVHNLPERVQRTLLRVIEDGKYSRIGASSVSDADVRFVFASNAPPPSYELAPDLLARLLVTPIPPLANRLADIPTIFQSLLDRALTSRRMSHIHAVELLGADHYEALLLDGFPSDNVRGLVDLADRIAARITLGEPPEDAVETVFSERFTRRLSEMPRRANSISEAAPHPTQDLLDGQSHYERNKDLIVSTLKACSGNLSATERVLRDKGLRCSRRWLREYATKWGVLRKPVE